MAPPSDARFALGTVLAGKFRIVRTLGAGGMGAVYEVEHEFTKHRRALKLLHAEFQTNRSVVERFLREASAAGRIGNPHIVETFDAGTLESGEPYVVMELLQGETLAQRLETGGPLRLADLCELVGQACDGVQAAHDSTIIHRDLKPENLFVLEREGRPFVKILDFGVSKFSLQQDGAKTLTREGAAIGTPRYMAPEQLHGERVDARADVYALGIVLYECATGRVPYDGNSLGHQAVLVHEGQAPPLAMLRPDLPAAFCEAVADAMRADRTTRTASARELGASLRRVAQAETGGAHTVVAQAATPGNAAAGADPTIAVGVFVGDRRRQDGPLPFSNTGLSERPPPSAAATTTAAVASAAAPVLRRRARIAVPTAVALAVLGLGSLGGVGWFVRSRALPAASSPPSTAATPAPTALPLEPQASTSPAVSSEPRVFAAPSPSDSGAPTTASARPGSSPPATSTRPAPDSSAPRSTAPRARPGSPGRPPLATENPFR